jgi:hypothetical protein
MLRSSLILSWLNYTAKQSPILSCTGRFAPLSQTGMRPNLMFVLCASALLFMPMGSAKAVLSPEQFLADWQPQGGQSRASGNSAGMRSEQHVVSKPLQEVWAFYAKKLGIEGEYLPNRHQGTTHGTPNGEVSVGLLSGGEEEGELRSVIFTRRDSQRLLTIHLSGTTSGKKTLVGLVVGELK